MKKQTIHKKDKTVEKENKISKEISQEILNKILKNLLRAIGLMIYFIVLNIAYSSIKHERLIEDIKVFAGVYLLIGLIMLEKAYKEDKGETAIIGIELLCIALHSLSIMHVITMFKYDFRYYLLTSSYIFSIYYVFKAIILYTKSRKEYLNSLSDISEIVKKEEPIKKEAKKRNEIEEKVSVKKQTKPKSIKRTKRKQNVKTDGNKKSRTSKKKNKKEVSKKRKTKKEVKDND